METIFWLVVAAAIFALVAMAAPYHERMIDNRSVPAQRDWD